MYVNTWHVHAEMVGCPYIITVYGITSESAAEDVAKRLRPVALSITIHHTTKETKRSRWQTTRRSVKAL